MQSQAKVWATQAKVQAIRAKEQFTPLAKSAQLTASQGVQQARTWAAPQVEQAGVAVQERIAPAVSAAMIATARRIQPVPPRNRRLWPAIVAGIVTVSAAAVAAILLRGQRANRFSAEPDTDAPPPPPVPPASDQDSSNERSETAQADVNGQVRTP